MSVFRRFAYYLLPYKLHILLVLVCTGLFVAFSSTAYWLTASFLQTLFTGGVEKVSQPGATASLNELLKYWTFLVVGATDPKTTLFRAAVAIVIAFLGKNLFGYLQLFYVSFVEQKVIKDLRDKLFAHLLLQDPSFFHERRRGNLISTVLNDVDTLNVALNKSFTKIIRDPLHALVIIGLLIAVSPKLALVALVLVPAVGWIVFFIGRKIRKHAAEVQRIIAGLTSHVQETVGGIRVVKAFAGEGFEKRRFAGLTRSFMKNTLRRERLRRMVIPLNEIVGILIISGLLYVGGDLVLVQKTIDSEDFIRFLVLLFALLDPILSLTSLVANIRVAEAAGGRVFELMDSEIHLKRKKDAVVPGNVVSGFRFEKVSFRYGPELPNVLSEIELEIRAGERIAVIGRSGSGKSTMINLLPRFYDPTDGRILLDGTDLRELDLDGLRKLFGVVTQQVILFHDTIAANIAYGWPQSNLEDIEKAARNAYAHDFISKLPRGYDTIVGEDGALLSGGQRQRISIARAFLRNPRVVLLDEAVSALDAESADEITAALERLEEGRTVVNVSHRIAAIRKVDRIVVLEKGRIVGIGSHNKLLKSCETYRIIAAQPDTKSGGEEPGGEAGVAVRDDA